MIEFLLEFVLQIVFEFFADVVLHAGWHGANRVLRSSIGRLVILVSVGFCFGVWWGSQLADAGQTNRPRLFWVSIALAAVAALGAWMRRGRPDDVIGVRTILRPPWQWGTARFVTFGALNVAIAAGIATGWSPPVVG